MLFRRYFQKDNGIGAYNVHIFEQGTPEIERYIKFRNWLRCHPEDREAYAALKQRLAERFPTDIMSYCLGKEDFVAGIDAKAGWDGVRLVIALMPSQWEAYHRICREQVFMPIGVAYDPNHPSLTADNHFHLVLFKGIKVVTMAHVEFLADNSVALRAFATDELYKQQGFGRTMLVLLERWLKQKGKSIVRMHAVLRSEHFYRNLGYSDMPFDDRPIANEIVDLGKLL